MIKIKQRRFHIPRNAQKAHSRRRTRRQKYRAFINALVSELRKKEECKELRTRRDEDRKKVLRRKTVSRKIRNKAKKLVKERKQEWRRKWGKWVEEEILLHSRTGKTRKRNIQSKLPEELRDLRCKCTKNSK